MKRVGVTLGFLLPSDYVDSVESLSIEMMSSCVLCFKLKREVYHEYLWVLKRKLHC